MTKVQSLRAAVLVPVGAVLASPSFAALPTDVTDAITAAKTDGILFATAVLVAIVGIWAFKLIRQGK